MESNHHLKKRRKEVQRLTLIVLGVMTVAIIGYTAYGLATETINMLIFGLLLGGFVVLYLVLSDIVEPYRLGLLRELTPEKRSAFLKVLLLDLIGGGALIYWIVGLGTETGSDLLIPFLIYFLTNQLKRKFPGRVGRDSWGRKGRRYRRRRGCRRAFPRGSGGFGAGKRRGERGLGTVDSQESGFICPLSSAYSKKTELFICGDWRERRRKV